MDVYSREKRESQSTQEKFKEKFRVFSLYPLIIGFVYFSFIIFKITFNRHLKSYIFGGAICCVGIGMF